MSPAVAAQPAVVPQHQPLWKSRVSEIFWINSVAISNDGDRVVAGTYLHDYKDDTSKFQPNVGGHFGTFCYHGGSKDPKWEDAYDGWDGIFGVAISADGKVAASGGWFQRTEQGATGIIRAYDTATGEKLLDFTGVTQRVSWVALSADGSILAAAADDVYIFRRVGAKFDATPWKAGVGMAPNPFISAIAMHPSGLWVAACDQNGNLFFLSSQNGVWRTAPPWQPESGAQIPFLSIAIAANRGSFAAAGGSAVYLFDSAPLLQGKSAPVLKYAFDDVTPLSKTGKLKPNARWVSISADGEFMTAVANRNPEKKPECGILAALKPAADRLEPLWTRLLDNCPNSTSVDPAGTLVTASDGYPTGRPSKFYLFDRWGNKQWEHTTYNMNWPMALSGNGKYIAAGCDDGTVLCFEP